MRNNEIKIHQKAGKLNGPHGSGLMDSLASTGTDLLIHHGIPWLGKKAVEMGRYYGSEALRNPKLQKKAIDYALDKLNPMIQNVGSQALDQLSTKIRPNKKYKTDRKDLDGAGIIDGLLTSGIAGSPWRVDYKKGIKLLTDPELWAPVNKMPVADAKKLVQYYKDQYKEAKKRGYNKSYNTFVKEMGWGKGFDIHNAILKVAPKKGFVMPGHKYTGPGNPIEQQLKYDPNSGKILEIYQQPTGKTDAVSMQHDVDYSVCSNKPKTNQVKCKNDADRKMVKALDAIPWKERQWGHTIARNAIATKAKIGFGQKKDNLKPYCDTKEIPKGKRLGNPQECIENNQIRYYGLEQITPKFIKNTKIMKKHNKETLKLNTSESKINQKISEEKQKIINEMTKIENQAKKEQSKKKPNAEKMKKYMATHKTLTADLKKLNSIKPKTKITQKEINTIISIFTKKAKIGSGLKKKKPKNLKRRRVKKKIGK